MYLLSGRKNAGGGRVAIVMGGAKSGDNGVFCRKRCTEGGRQGGISLGQIDGASNTIVLVHLFADSFHYTSHGYCRRYV